MITTVEHFDIAIIGGGLAGLMTADLLAESTDPQLRIAIIDPNPESLSTKTFSSWQKKSDPPHRYSKLVSGRWEQFRITTNDGEKIERDFGAYTYESIPGERLGLHLNQKLAFDPRFHRVSAAVLKIHEHKDSASSQLQARIELSEGQSLTASQVLSSPADHPAALLQIFLGFEIQTPTEHFDPKRVDLMDFRVEQAGDVRFVYLLPFSKRSALVELTVFSRQKISMQECEALLKTHLSQTLCIPVYEIKKIESGTIPMGVDVEPLFPPSFQSSLICGIGSAASRIKPSTGYSFKNNLDALRQPRAKGYSDFRFRVYDSILLEQIREKKSSVSRSLSQLFSRNSPAAVFSFLDEKSDLLQELRIFLSLPKLPFGFQLMALYPFVFAFAATLALHSWAGGLAVWIVPTLGLLTAGMGHGSLDSLLRPSGTSQTGFYLRYLGAIALFLSSWLISPPLALLFFIVQSADHFGESYWLRSLLASRNDWRVRTLTWIWGLFSALFSVFFHWNEALPVVSAL
ncbi:MAG: hypothetical protein KGQ59_12495, partial [Bdellovibrionales bacterium]|nr:hypothetical protein [Bdellovibrionales bacterium]